MFEDSASEIRLIACILDDPELIFKLKPELFTRDNINVFIALRECFLKYGEISTEGVERFYGRPLSSEYDAARGAKPSAIIDRLAECASRRQLARIQNDINTIVSKPVISLEDVSNVLRFTPVLTQQDTSNVNGAVKFLTDLVRKREGKYDFIHTGLSFLDYMLGGEWPRQALSILMAQPGTGKTAFVNQSALLMAEQYGQSSLIVSLEMTADRLIARQAANLAKVDGLKLRSGSLSDIEMDQITRATEHIQNLPIRIFDKRGSDVDTIIDLLKSHAEAYNTKVCFIDYLQLISRDDNNDAVSLGHITWKLREAAQLTDMSIIILAQQNRGYEGLNSLMGSSKPVQDADVVIEMKSNGQELKQEDDPRMITFDFLKNRDGPVGQSSVMYIPKYLKFVDPVRKDY